jgi:hypothetical protein
LHCGNDAFRAQLSARSLDTEKSQAAGKTNDEGVKSFLTPDARLNSDPSLNAYEIRQLRALEIRRNLAAENAMGLLCAQGER